jgi:hypothetical protein
MSTTWPSPTVEIDVTSASVRSRRLVRWPAATLSATIAVLYGLIAANVVTVLDGPAEQVARDQMAFGTPALVAYLLGAVLLARYDRQMLWIAGAVLQVLVIAMYIDVASDRDPAFEVWGVVIRVLQVALLILLTYLAVRRPPGRTPRRRAAPTTG